MLRFDSFIRLLICANTRNERETWAARFEEYLGCSNRSILAGTWVEGGVRTFEPNIAVEVWGPTWEQVSGLLRLAQQYQYEARQQGVSVVWSGPDGWHARIVEADREADGSVRLRPLEWAEVERDLARVFNEAGQVEDLIRYFSGPTDADFDREAERHGF